MDRKFCCSNARSLSNDFLYCRCAFRAVQEHLYRDKTPQNEAFLILKRVIINSWPTANFCPAKEVIFFFLHCFCFSSLSQSLTNHQIATSKTHLRFSHLFCVPGNFSACARQCCPLDGVTWGAAQIPVSSCSAGLGSHCLKSHGVFSVTLQAANHSWGKHLPCAGMITQIWTTSPSPLCTVTETLFFLLLLPSSAILARTVHTDLALVCPTWGPEMLLFHSP